MLFCKRTGQITKQPLVFLHGFLGSHKAWTPFMDYFSRDYYVIALDLPGHGNSTNMGWNEIKAAIPNDSILIGYSMGGRIALSLLMEDPSRYHSGVIFSANPGLESAEEISNRIVIEEGWIRDLRAYNIEEFLTKWYKQPMFGNLKASRYSFEQNIDGLIHALSTFSITKQKNFWDQLPSFTKPITFLFGEQDTKYVEIGKRLPGSKLIKNAAHSVIIQNPTDSIAYIEKHLQEYIC